MDHTAAAYTLNQCILKKRFQRDVEYFTRIIYFRHFGSSFFSLMTYLFRTLVIAVFWVFIHQISHIRIFSHNKLHILNFLPIYCLKASFITDELCSAIKALNTQFIVLVTIFQGLQCHRFYYGFSFFFIVSDISPGMQDYIIVSSIPGFGLHNRQSGHRLKSPRALEACPQIQMKISSALGDY